MQSSIKQSSSIVCFVPWRFSSTRPKNRIGIHIASRLGWAVVFLYRRRFVHVIMFLILLIPQKWIFDLGDGCHDAASLTLNSLGLRASVYSTCTTLPNVTSHLQFAKKPRKTYANQYQLYYYCPLKKGVLLMQYTNRSIEKESSCVARKAILPCTGSSLVYT